MTDTRIEDVATTLRSRNISEDYISLNAKLDFWAKDENGEFILDKNGQKTIPYEEDRKSVRQYFRDQINPNFVHFLDLKEKLTFLVDEEYYEAEFLAKYDFEFVKGLYKHIYGFKFRFPTFVGAFKFYSSYALKTFDGKRYLESFEDRIVATALYIADGDEKFATSLAEEIISGRFQPATPTFLNAGKKSRGELVSCFLLNITDDLNGIMRAVNSAAQLSKRGGGVALNLSNLRAKGDPIKKIENQASGVVPVMKILEDTFSYANQLGARQGAGAVYLNAHHFDITDFLDTKRENADEKSRIKTLSLGVVIPDVTIELAKQGKNMYLFSPYDIQKVYGKEFSWVNISEIYHEAVENPNIRKKSINARHFLNTIAEIQMESGYPYILFEDAANRANSVPGKIIMSNLCVEILQTQEPGVLGDDQIYETVGKDISCNLGSMNIQKALESPDFGRTVEIAVRTLSVVSDRTDITSVPSVAAGNRRSHSIGLGSMNLHGAFAKNHMFFGDEESLDLTNMFFYVQLFHALRTSNLIAKERGVSFDGFENSKYASGEFFEKFVSPVNDFYSPKTAKVANIFAENGIVIPSVSDWVALAAEVKRFGLYNAFLLAVPPTGSISYVNNSTPSTLPATNALVESRTEGKLGTVHVPNAYAEGNEEFYVGYDMFSIDPKAVIDVNSVVQHYVDQSISLTLGYKSDATTADVNRSILYAFGKGKPSGKDWSQALVEGREKLVVAKSKAGLAESVWGAAEDSLQRARNAFSELPLSASDDLKSIVRDAVIVAEKDVVVASEGLVEPRKVVAVAERAVRAASEQIDRANVLNKFPSAAIKTLYYVRVKNLSVEGTMNTEECVSCAL